MLQQSESVATSKACLPDTMRHAPAVGIQDNGLNI